MPMFCIPFAKPKRVCMRVVCSLVWPL